MSSSASDSVMVVTGATSGIGAAIVAHAGERGYRLVLGARSAADVRRAAATLGGAERAIGVPCDITDWGQQQRMITSAREHFGGVDVVVANAGTELGPTISDIDGSPEQWREMVLTNVYGTALTARAAIPELVRRRGRLVLIGSVTGRVAIPDDLYSATKWAVTGLAEALRSSLASRGVGVLHVLPGRVRTSLQDPSSPEPMLTAEEVARVVVSALEQPPGVSINEIVLRPTGQEV